MMTLSPRLQLGIGALLAALLFLTHGHHFASAVNLPAATWAVMFLAGLYVRRAALFWGLVAEVVVIDYVAITFGGVSSFCVSPAYILLLPTYGALWLAGRWYAGRHRMAMSALPTLGASLLGSATVAELLSSGGFYLFSGRFAEHTFSEFAGRLVAYFPHSLASFAFWIGAAALVHLAFALTARGAQGVERTQV